ncbi:MAG: two-component system response regulator BaeR [Oceanicoccus sp.]|jgi:two-component system response regulator BaeR
MSSIVIVEDEKKLARVLADYFAQSGFDHHCIYHGDEVIDYIKQTTVDLILLDIMLPGKDGVSLCKEIRSFSNTPIIMLTARADEIDRLLGLELGADDYICKPFSPREVVARVKAVLRRSQPQAQGNTLGSSDFHVDDSRLQISYQQQYVEFTHVEFQLLQLLSSEPGRIYSRNQLMDAMYSDHRVVSDRTIDSHIKKIRKKLASNFNNTEFIQSVYGAGYRFEIDTGSKTT